MSKASPKLTWCVVRFGDDMNWWVKEISDPVHWDSDCISIIDPNQITYILDLLDELRAYGLSTEIVENAFIPFQIQDVKKEDKTARLVRVNESLFDTAEKIFALPDIIDEDKGAYSEFLDHITLLRMKYLNDKLELAQKLTVSEIEEQILEAQTQDYMEGRATHLFREIIDILEFVPAGYEIGDDDDEDEKIRAKDAEDFSGVGDLPELDDEKLEEDDTMRWDDDSSAGGNGDFAENPEPEEKPEPKKRSRRRR